MLKLRLLMFPSRWRLCVLLIGLLAASDATAVSAITIDAARVQSEQGEARDVHVQWHLKKPPAIKGKTQQPDLKATARVRAVGDAGWQAMQFNCGALSLPQRSGQWQCTDGLLKSERMHVPFNLAVSRRTIHGQSIFGASIELNGVTYNDAAGTHASDKLVAGFTLNASQRGKKWDWVADLDWKSGELYWQPFYVEKGGHRLHAEGSLDNTILDIRQAVASLNGIGRIDGAAIYNRSTGKLQSAAFNAQDLNLAQAYPVLFKPLLTDTAMDDLDIEGKASVSGRMENGEPRSFHLVLNNVDIEDKKGVFALYKIDADIPWDYDQAQSVALDYEGGHVLKIPLAQSRLRAEFNRYSVTAPELRLNILDGALVLSDVSAAILAGRWHWHLRAMLTPLDMPALSSALGWPRMEGKVAAAIPMVTYSNGALTTDGALGFNLFNGSIRMSNLSMQDPLGPAPQLNADLELRNLDLGALTRTFSFGAIEGKLDGDVANLTLSGWKPVNFDASFESSPGRYPRKISQRAVENISALGGAGAAAAIQRSFLRFFKEFNYQKLGVSCRLRNDVCAMSGVETTPQGFVIVKGSGVPAITVLGYNREVNWSELISRIQRVTGNNVKPVIQ